MRRKHRFTSGLFTNIFLAALIAALYYATHPGSAVPAAAPVHRGGGNGVALQFAVSWDAAALPDILDTLNKSGVRATFAVSGKWADDNPELLERIAADGHEIAAMGYYPEMDGGLKWTLNDLKRSLNTIEGLTGERPSIYYEGERSGLLSAAAAKILGVTAVSETIDLLSAKGTAEDILSRLPEKPIEGSILLLRPTAACSEALPGIINAIQLKGMGLTVTGDLISPGE